MQLNAPFFAKNNNYPLSNRIISGRELNIQMIRKEALMVVECLSYQGVKIVFKAVKELLWCYILWVSDEENLSAYFDAWIDCY